jgi:hypothetical protein
MNVSNRSLFAVSLITFRRGERGGITTTNAAFMVEALSADEARGKATRISRKLFPDRQTEIAVSSVNNVVDPDGGQIRVTGGDESSIAV